MTQVTASTKSYPTSVRVSPDKYTQLKVECAKRNVRLGAALSTGIDLLLEKWTERDHEADEDRKAAEAMFPWEEK